MRDEGREAFQVQETLGRKSPSFTQIIFKSLLYLRRCVKFCVYSHGVYSLVGGKKKSQLYNHRLKYYKGKKNSVLRELRETWQEVQHLRGTKKDSIV